MALVAPRRRTTREQPYGQAGSRKLENLLGGLKDDILKARLEASSSSSLPSKFCQENFIHSLATLAHRAGELAGKAAEKVKVETDQIRDEARAQARADADRIAKR